MTQTIAETIITANDLNLSYGHQNILVEANLTVHKGDKIGLVGVNGCGKSSFLKILAGVELPDSGDVIRRRDLVTGFLPQEFVLDNNLTVHENILAGARHITDLIAEFESLLPHSNRAHDLEVSIQHCDGWNLPNRIETFITRLGCPGANTNVASLSGGEKRRVALAKALVSEPDLLLLDEPTNHLDAESIEWLEEYLHNYRGACLFVTHDRYFLDRISSSIVELSRGVFTSYEGNYSDYLKKRAEALEREEIAEAKRQSFLRRELEWVRRGPKARTTKAQYRVNRYYDVASQEPPEKQLDVDLIIPPPPRMGNQVVSLEHVGMAFGDRRLFTDLDLDIMPGAKIGIIGPNGVGKSTLLRIILGKLQPSSGTVKISDNTRFNYVDQNRLQLNDDNSVIEEIGEGCDFIFIGDQKLTIWSYLKRFLFTDERIKTNVGRLSGGERARLMLAKILKNGGNFIVLDEPTNDLDLTTLRLLEDALVSFGGCVLVVSHDRYFLNRVCSATLAFEKTGSLVYHEGNYDYYMSKRSHFYKGLDGKPVQKDEPKSKQKTKQQKLSWKEERELEGMEEAIMELEEKLEALQNQFMDPEFFKQSPEKVAELKAELDTTQAEKDKLYARWEELEALQAALTNES